MARGGNADLFVELYEHLPLCIVDTANPTLTTSVASINSRQMRATD